MRRKIDDLFEEINYLLVIRTAKLLDCEQHLIGQEGMVAQLGLPTWEHICKNPNGLTSVWWLGSLLDPPTWPVTRIWKGRRIVSNKEIARMQLIRYTRSEKGYKAQNYIKEHMEVDIRYSHTFLGRTGGFSRHCAGYLVPKTSTSNSPLLTKFWSGNRD